MYFLFRGFLSCIFSICLFVPPFYFFLGGITMFSINCYWSLPQALFKFYLHGYGINCPLALFWSTLEIILIIVFLMQFNRTDQHIYKMHYVRKLGCACIFLYRNFWVLSFNIFKDSSVQSITKHARATEIVQLKQNLYLATEAFVKKLLNCKTGFSNRPPVETLTSRDDMVEKTIGQLFSIPMDNFHISRIFWSIFSENEDFLCFSVFFIQYSSC